MQTFAIKRTTAPITKAPTNGSGSFEFLIHSFEIDHDNERCENFLGLPTTVPLQYQHTNNQGMADPGANIGVARAYSDPVGLHGYAQLDLENPLGIATYERLLLPADHPLHLGELSIGFSYDTTKAWRGAKGETVLPDVELIEISVVHRGAQRTEVLNVKAKRRPRCRRGVMCCPSRGSSRRGRTPPRCARSTVRSTCGHLKL